MTKEYLESILTEYGVAFTDSLADRLLMEFKPCEDAISRQAVLEYTNRILNQGTGKKKSFEFIQKYVEKLPPVNPQNCDACEVGNPCLYCRHEFEPQKSEE